jgi:pimeloyl-ACP methyl ester carboxylesterase
MNIVQAGAGETIIFIHGLVGNQKVFRHQFSYFSKKYHVVSYDYIGHGENSRDVAFTLDNLVEELKVVYEKAGVEKAHLCSVSFGCYIASNYAAKYPEQVLSLCQIGGSYNNPSPLIDVFSMLWKRKNMEYSSWVRLFAESIIPFDPSITDSISIKSRDIFIENAMQMDPNILKETCRLRISYDMKKIIRNIYQPMMWVMGEFDYLYKTCLYDLTRLAPQIQYIDLPEAGHVAHVFQPDIFQEIYANFLTNNCVANST